MTEEKGNVMTDKQLWREMENLANEEQSLARDLQFMFSLKKDTVAGMVFNPNDEKMIIVLKDLLLPIMPGEKPKPEFYRE